MGAPTTFYCATCMRHHPIDGFGRTTASGRPVCKSCCERIDRHVRRPSRKQQATKDVTRRLRTDVDGYIRALNID